MTTLIVGAGASGLVLAIRLKLNNPNQKVIIIDKNNKPGRKLCVTGNGRCNIGNINLSSDYYRNVDISNLVFEKYNVTKQCDFFENLGIKTKQINELFYPYSESAKTFVDYLYNYALKQNIIFKFEEELIDYKNETNNIIVETNKTKYIVDKLVFATGGKSYKNLGSDGKIFDTLKKHNYLINKLYPGLCPIRTEEKTKSISGVRIKSNVTLFLDGKKTYKEKGEVLFKDDGLSGIAIFNVSSFVARNISEFNEAKIVLDLFPNCTLDQLEDEFVEKNKKCFSNVLLGYFLPNLANYILKRINRNIDEILNTKDIKSLAYTCKNLTFTYKDLYDFDNAQITIGGIDISDIDEKLSSKIEHNVYFVGEIIDNDGLCGGFNLMWAFGSALYLGDLLCK